MANPPPQLTPRESRTAKIVLLFVFLSVVFAVVSIAVTNRQYPAPGPDPVAGETVSSSDQAQADSQATMAQAEANPITQKANHYGGPDFDAEREAVCVHFRQHPDVIQAVVDTAGGTEDPTIDVTVRPGMTDRQILPLAHRIRRYLAAHFQGDRSLIITTVNIHHPGSDSAYLTEFDRRAGLDNTKGMVGAMITNGQDETDEKIDPVYHVIQNQRAVD